MLTDNCALSFRVMTYNVRFDQIKFSVSFVSNYSAKARFGFRRFRKFLAARGWVQIEHAYVIGWSCVIDGPNSHYINAIHISIISMWLLVMRVLVFFWLVYKKTVWKSTISRENDTYPEGGDLGASSYSKKSFFISCKKFSFLREEPLSVSIFKEENDQNHSLTLLGKHNIKFNLCRYCIFSSACRGINDLFFCRMKKK